MNKLTEALNNGTKLEELVEQLHLEVSYRYDELSNLVQLNYAQFEPSHPISDECRGLIINLNNNAIVANPFGRFFNLGQSGAAQIDWSSAKVLPKLDGSLIIATTYGLEPLISTRGSIGAKGPVGSLKQTFNELFWEIWNKNGYQLDWNPYFTYMFELTSTKNQIVCHYPKDELTLLSVRETSTGIEQDLDTIHTNGTIPKIKPVELKTIEEIQAYLKDQPASQTEGFVVVDKHWNRLKVKSEAYVRAHHMRDKVTPRGILEVIKNHEEDELLSYFPYMAPQVNSIKGDIYKLAQEIRKTFWAISPGIQSRKEFAAKALPYKYSSILFKLLEGEDINTLDYLLNQIHPDRLLNWIGVKP